MNSDPMETLPLEDAPAPRNFPFIATLEDEAVDILREAAAVFHNPVLLFSGGKDSAALLHLAIKAFAPGPMPFPLLHIDTGHNFPEIIEFRDRIVAETGARLIVASVQESIDRGKVHERVPNQGRNAMQAVTLMDAISDLKIDACIGGARRDEEKARAKERNFSHRDEFGKWDPRNQRPEPWGLYNSRIFPGENMRVFPISNWTEIDIWHYIAREQISLPELYFAHKRPVFRRQGMLFPLTPFTQPDHPQEIEELTVRFRTVGDMSCTCPVESSAATLAEIIIETQDSRISERGATRSDDKREIAAMEMRKKAGYF